MIYWKPTISAKTGKTSLQVAINVWAISSNISIYYLK